MKVKLDQMERLKWSCKDLINKKDLDFTYYTYCLHRNDVIPHMVWLSINHES